MSGYRRLLVAALGAVVWACGDGAGPSDFDPAPLEEQLFDLSNDFFNTSSPFAVGLLEIEIYMRPVDIDTLVGKTIEFVQSPGKFAITTRTGAPPDAARFLLYQAGNNSESSAAITLPDSDLHYEGSIEAIWGGSGPWSNISSTLVDGTGGLAGLAALEVSGQFSGTVRVQGADFATFTGPDRDHPTYSGVWDTVVTPADRPLFDRKVLSRSLPTAPRSLMEVASSFVHPVSIY